MTLKYPFGFFTALFLVLGISQQVVWADTGAGGDVKGWSSVRPDGHAPIGVMRDHVHKRGEWMASYRYMNMTMDGNRDGTNGRTEAEVLADFMITPTEMVTEMHMLGLMYAPTDDLTLMAMLPHIEKSMRHINRAGVRFTTQSEGIGDLKAAALYVLRRFGNQQLHLNAGINVPIGAIDRRDQTPAGPSQKLPYPMQIGSGTWDLSPGLTYLGQTEKWSWGGQFLPTLRLGRNDEHYTLGDQYYLTAWGAHRWTDWLSSSVRLEQRIWGNITGADPELTPTMVPTADPNRRGGKRLDLLMGFNWYAREGWLKGHRLAVEGGFPVYQSLDGPQLENDWRVIVGWQYAWGN